MKQFFKFCLKYYFFYLKIIYKQVNHIGKFREDLMENLLILKPFLVVAETKKKGAGLFSSLESITQALSLGM